MAFDRDHTPFAVDGACISGVALAVDATLIHESIAAAAYLRQQILDLAMAGSNLSVAVRWSDTGTGSADTFRFLCDRLGAALDDAGARSCRIGLLVDAISLAPLTAWKIRNAHLGTGPLYVGTSQQLMQECHWEQLWQQRSNTMIRPVYVSFVSSQCRLLPVEAANGVMPCTDIQAPTGSAWVNVPVDISSFADIDGDLDEEALELTIRAGVEAGDETHSLARWPTAQMRHDGWLNRRLAINLTGIGTLVQRRDADPTRFQTLDEMCRLIRPHQGRRADTVAAPREQQRQCAGPGAGRPRAPDARRSIARRLVTALAAGSNGDSRSASQPAGDLSVVDISTR